jgi:malate/lactate dehydrogenase
MKIGMIGAGRVGSAALLSLVMRGCAREIVVVNRDRKRARGVATDLQYGASLAQTSRPVGRRIATIRPAGCACSTRTQTCIVKSFPRSFVRRRTR